MKDQRAKGKYANREAYFTNDADAAVNGITATASALLGVSDDAIPDGAVLFWKDEGGDRLGRFGPTTLWASRDAAWKLRPFGTVPEGQLADFGWRYRQVARRIARKLGIRLEVV